jgi:5'-deoxynucleotidase YfbR-like HD superfamily hydrolase
MRDSPEHSEWLPRLIFDAVAAKRVIKTGYVRQPGGLYPTQCDTVAAHSHTISVVAVTLASQLSGLLQEKFGVVLKLEDVALMAIFHDYGEAKSGDTGATSIAIYGTCKLYSLERDGLQASLAGLQFEEKIMHLFDDYRKYRTSEAVVVHVADNLEGFEKAIHSGRGSGRMLADMIRIFQENVAIYRQRRSLDRTLGDVADFLVDHVLVPGTQAIADAYELPVNMAEQAAQAVSDPADHA